MKTKIIFLSVIFLIAPLARSEFDFESDTTLEGIHRNFPNGASKLTNFFEAYAETLTGVKNKGDTFQFEAKVLVRTLQSPINTDKNDFAYPDMTPPRRLFKLYETYGDGDSQNQTVIDAGTLWASYNIDNWQFTGGRRAIGVGVLKVIPVWNRLYPVVPTTSGYMFVNNPDIVDVRWSTENWSVAAYSIFSQFFDEAINALELTHYGETLESHFLISQWWNQPTVGYSGVVDTESGIWRLETLAVAQDAADTQKGFQIGAGWERAFTADFTFLVEYYHSTFGTSKKEEYLLQDPTPFRILLASDYLYPQLVYKLSDFASTELGSLTNLIDRSFMLISETTYSYSDNVSLFALIKVPVGNKGQEFGHLEVPVTEQAVEYVEWISAGVKMTI